MRLTACLLAVVMLLAIVMEARAQGDLEEDALKKDPGYVNFDAERPVGSKTPSIEIFIRKPLLQMVSAIVGKEEPELGKLLRKLKLIQVRVFQDVADYDRASALKNAASIARSLAKKGWEKMVAIREKDQAVDILLKMQKDSIAGLAVLVVEADQVVLVNIVGELDPALLGQLAGNLGVPDMPALKMPLKMDPKEPADEQPVPKPDEPALEKEELDD
jgi:hypothetical protein